MAKTMANPQIVNPIGTLFCNRQLKLEAPRQGAFDHSQEIARITLNAGHNFEQALEDIEGFSHIWLIYLFDQNKTWKPKVKPPRGSVIRRGVFATRSPYRPNPIGMSCVQLIEKKGRHLWVTGSDLLDGTPILDIKPYIIESDSFPQAKQGWLEGRYRFSFHQTGLFQRQLRWLEDHGLNQLASTIYQQLEIDPFDGSSKRVRRNDEDSADGTYAYRTWRIAFAVGDTAIELQEIFSGYSNSEIASDEDPYQDKELHRRFISAFGSYFGSAFKTN